MNDCEEDDESMAAIGFMFDASHSRIMKSVVVSSNITIDLTLIGEDPGHVQSGQYLWPAALFASRHLVANWSLLAREMVLELGSGCGLAGLTVCMLPGTRRVILTDYDPGCLSILGENYKINCRKNDASSPETQNFADVGIYQYIWGSSDASFRPMDGFGLIIGTDLLYCQEVVKPLLTSVNNLIRAEGGIFVLVSSFEVGEVFYFL